MIETFFQICKDYTDFMMGRIFYQETSSEKAQLLIKKGYIKPHTTKIFTKTSGSIDLHHYVVLKKGRRLKRFILAFAKIGLVDLRA